MRTPSVGVNVIVDDVQGQHVWSYFWSSNVFVFRSLSFRIFQGGFLWEMSLTLHQKDGPKYQNSGPFNFMWFFYVFSLAYFLWAFNPGGPKVWVIDFGIWANVLGTCVFYGFVVLVSGMCLTTLEGVRSPAVRCRLETIDPLRRWVHLWLKKTPWSISHQERFLKIACIYSQGEWGLCHLDL